MLLKVPVLKKNVRAREMVTGCAREATLEDSPPGLPTLALALEHPDAKVVADVAPHAVLPADDPQTPAALLPLLFPDEALIAVSRPLDAPTKLHQALAENNAVYRWACHELLQPIPLPEYFPEREILLRDLPEEKQALRVLPRGALVEI